MSGRTTPGNRRVTKFCLSKSTLNYRSCVLCCVQIEDLNFGDGDAYCFCKPGFDVRCCCVPENPTWRFCRMRASTAYFIMGNDREIYDRVEEEGIDKVDLKFRFRLTASDWEQIKDWYKEDHPEEEEDSEEEHSVAP